MVTEWQDKDRREKFEFTLNHCRTCLPTKYCLCSGAKHFRKPKGSKVVPYYALKHTAKSPSWYKRQELYCNQWNDISFHQQGFWLPVPVGTLAKTSRARFMRKLSSVGAKLGTEHSRKSGTIFILETMEQFQAGISFP